MFCAYSQGGVDNNYFGFLRSGRFQIPLCHNCSRFHFYPRINCPHCGSCDLSWREPSGLGTVYATTAVYGRQNIYNISLVELDEGPRLMTRVENEDPRQVEIGQRVEFKISHEDGEPLLVFVPIDGAK